jgi:hypothetical protein
MWRSDLSLLLCSPFLFGHIEQKDRDVITPSQLIDS